jgi:FecR protein
MKLFQAFVSALVGGVVLTLAYGAHAQSANPQYATAVRIQGEARYSADGTTWHPLVVGKVLGPGDLIQSAADSKVDLVLGDRIGTRVVPTPDKVGPAADPYVRGLISYKAQAVQNVIRLQGDTVLAINKLSAESMGADTVTDTELDLRQGTIFGSVKKLSAASQYLIKTPNGMAAIRGTTFELSADGKIIVTDGSAVISVLIGGKTVTQTVLAGQQFDPTTGQVTQLTPQDMSTAKETALETQTVTEGVISFANDTTTIYVSPTHGVSPDNHPAWPF